MPKIIAVTGIKHSGEFIEAGGEVDASQFTRAELRELHDNGAIVVEDSTKPEDVRKADGSDLTPAELGQTGEQTADVSAEAKASTAAQINKAAETPAKETPAKK